MADFMTVAQQVQIAAETTSGTLVPATKQLQLMNIIPGSKPNKKFDAPAGGAVDIRSILGREHTEAKITGAGNFNEILYFLNSVLGVGAISTPSGGTLSRAHLFKLQQYGIQAVKTISVEKGIPGVKGYRFGYGLCTELEIMFMPEDVTISGTLLGKRIEHSISMTTSGLTLIAANEIEPTTVNFKYSATSGGLDAATALSAGFKGGLKISGRHQLVKPVRSSFPDFARHAHAKPTLAETLMLGYDGEVDPFLSSIRNGDKIYTRMEATGPIIEAAIPYSLVIDVFGEVKEVGDFGEEQDGIGVNTYTINPLMETTWQSPFLVTVTNAQATL